MRLAAGLCPEPLGELERSPRPPSRNWGCLLLRGRGGKGKREGRGWEGRREEGEGKEGRGKGREGMGKEERKGRGGEGGKEKDDLHPTLFLGPALISLYWTLVVWKHCCNFS